MTDIVYLLSVDGHFIDPQIVFGVTQEILLEELTAVSSTGVSFEVYVGETIRYDQQYSLAFVGTVEMSMATLVTSEITLLWQQTLVAGTSEKKHCNDLHSVLKLI